MNCPSNNQYFDEDAEVLFSVGRRFVNGNGVDKDVAKGKEMLAQAAALGHSMAARLLEQVKASEAEAAQAADTAPAGAGIAGATDSVSEIDHMLAFNRQFVESRAYEQYHTSKYPDKKIAIVTCMDTRLVQLLPAALGIKNGDVKIIKNAGGTITNPFDSTVRSLLVAVYELGVNEVMVIGHTSCGVQGMDGQEMLSLMRARGVDEEHISLMKHCGIDLESWLHGFDDTDAAVLETVDLIRNHPLMPKDITVGGYIMDSVTGALERAKEED